MSVVNETEILESLIKRKISEYKSLSAVNGISQTEMNDLALKLKRRELGPERILQISLDAEKIFLQTLREKYPQHYGVYLRIKGGVATPSEITTWKSISEELKEREIKNNYIEDRMSVLPGDNHKVMAVKEITERKFLERKKKLNKRFDSERVTAFLDLESRANEIVYPTEFEEKILKSEKPTIRYYFCLRYCPENGNFGVASDLEEFSFIDLDVKRQSRIGTSKKFQLDTIKELIQTSGGIINHEVIVADSDLDKFEDISNKSKEAVEEYLLAVRSYLKGFGKVIGAREFFGQRGLNEKEYLNLENDLIRGNCNPNLMREFSRDLEGNRVKMKRSFNWTDSMNLHYTSRALAKNVLEGKLLSQLNEGTILGIFDKSAAIGRQFNLNSQKRLPCIAFPRMPNNLDGFCYA